MAAPLTSHARYTFTVEDVITLSRQGFFRLHDQD